MTELSWEVSVGDEQPMPRGHLEMALLEALWERPDEERSARDLHGAVGRARGIVYTTVAKVLDRMVLKGLVTRQRRGRAYVYRPLTRRGETQRTLVRDVLTRVFRHDLHKHDPHGHDPRPAVAALVGALEDISPDLLDELAAELAARKEESDGA